MVKKAKSTDMKKPTLSQSSLQISLDPDDVPVPIYKIFNTKQIQNKYKQMGKGKAAKESKTSNDDHQGGITKADNSIIKIEVASKPEGVGKNKAIHISPQKNGIPVSPVKDEVVILNEDELKIEHDKFKTGINNVFKLLMENRNRVIGANTDGKLLSPSKQEPSPTSREKLQAQKERLEELSKKKINAKKNTEETREQQIKNVLNSRAARMKEMLNAQAENSQDISSPIGNEKPVTKQDTGSKSKRLSTKKTKKTSVDLDVTNDDLFLNGKDKPKRKSKVKSSSIAVEEVVEKQQPSPPRRSSRPRAKLNYSELDEKENHTNSKKQKVLAVDVDKEEDDDEVKPIAKSKKKLQDKTEIVKAKEKKQAAKEAQDDEKKRALAPIFMKGKPKPKLDPQILEARNSFLHSGVPTILKRTVEKQSMELQESAQLFPLVSHIQQKCTSSLWGLHQLPEMSSKNLSDDPDFIRVILSSNNFHYAVDSSSGCNVKLNPPIQSENVDEILQRIKSEVPEFPVYRCFKIFRERNGFVYNNGNERKSKKRRSSGKRRSNTAREPREDLAMWTEKYRALSAQEIIGNQRPVQALKEWLDTWQTYTMEDVNNAKGKRKRRPSSDFESDSNCSERLPGNAMILRGPPGSGKSFTVNAVCKELGINVLELNVSSRRTGKRLLQEMQEATQSHQVRNENSANSNSLSKFITATPSKTSGGGADADKRSKMCVLLIDDVDLVFDQDEGFIAALSQLLVTSKRPIILTATDVNVPHLQKFILQYPILHFAALSATTLATYLQVMCLVEGLNVERQSLGHLLEWNKGDVRRTLLQLQFWLRSGGDGKCDTIDCRKHVFHREKRNARTPRQNFDKFDEFYNDFDDCTFLLSGTMAKPLKELEVVHANCIRSCTSDSEHIIPDPLDLGAFWWNMPHLLGYEPMQHGPTTRKDEAVSQEESDNALADLIRLSDGMDALCMCDTINRSERRAPDIEPCPRQWEDVVQDGLQLKAPSEEYRSDRSVSDEISHFLLESVCNMSSAALKAPSLDWDFANPSAPERKWRHKRFDCMSQFQDAASMHKRCEHAAFALDYFPMMQGIARMEATRQQGSQKRGKRFYHYFKTIGVDITQTALKTACAALQY